ncbi:MAG TPA: hypothetical protein VGR95_08845 [Thermoanaerobaculia bacterium]|jgi:hypothetical protein|nr:hypothetical protein [Thermoanaerobaculia bacterium]
MELRLAHVESFEIAQPARRVFARRVETPFLFVTYAVEIEGEAPLIVPEAVDD